MSKSLSRSVKKVNQNQMKSFLQGNISMNLNLNEGQKPTSTTGIPLGYDPNKINSKLYQVPLAEVRDAKAFATESPIYTVRPRLKKTPVTELNDRLTHEDADALLIELFQDDELRRQMRKRYTKADLKMKCSY